MKKLPKRIIKAKPEFKKTPKPNRTTLGSRRVKVTIGGVSPEFNEASNEHDPLLGMAISFSEDMNEWAGDYIKQKTQNTGDL